MAALQGIPYHHIADLQINMALFQQWHKVFSSQHTILHTIEILNALIKRGEAPASTLTALKMCRRAIPVVNTMLSNSLSALFCALQNKSYTPFQRSIAFHIIQATQMAVVCQSHFCRLSNAVILQAQRK